MQSMMTGAMNCRHLVPCQLADDKGRSRAQLKDPSQGGAKSTGIGNSSPKLRRNLDGFPAPSSIAAPVMSEASTIKVHVPAPLREYCNGARELSFCAPTVRAALGELERNYPLLYRGVCEETGRVRRHINLFVNASHIRDRDGLETALEPGDVLFILPAVSGG